MALGGPTLRQADGVEPDSLNLGKVSCTYSLTSRAKRKHAGLDRK